MPHLIYVAVGFPPAAKSCAYRMREVANLVCEQGWDVTVVTLNERAWSLEYGLDHTLLADVDPRVRVVELPLARRDLEPDVRRYSWLRARHPDAWARARFRLDELAFPEGMFGSWRSALERAVLEVHRERPADLLMVSPAPYTTLAAAWALHERHGVPYVVDFRDAWSLNVLTGEEALAPDSRAGRWERRLVENALETWVVNEPIAQWYAHRYPHLRGRIRVVRNGFDPVDIPAGAPRSVGPDQPPVFGYLGTLNVPYAQTRRLLEGWRHARRADRTLKRARLVFRGHLGMGMARGANSNAAAISRAAIHDVEYGGPVAKAEVAGVYAGWDALVLALAGGRYVTSGKVYEYMATGLPIVSAHEPEHAATEVLDGYPLWVPARSTDQPDITDAFVRAVRVIQRAGPDERAAGRRHAARFERRAQLRPAIQAVTSSVVAPREVAR
jgi:glycosyltransferase involved in cell wall biosynthesis